MNDVDVLVIGGGISGLATAWCLAREGLDIEVWESTAQAGGKIRTDRTAGYLTERGAAAIMNFRPEVNRLIDELDLGTCKVAPAPGVPRYLLQDGALIAVPMRLSAMVRSPLWSWHGKLRLLAEPFIPRGGHDEETVSEFICRRLGQEVLDKAIEPFIAGVLASDPDLANAHAALPRLTELERRYGSLTLGILVHRLLRRRDGCPRESFSFAGGMSTLVRSFARAPGVYLHCAHRAVELVPVRSGWRVAASSPSGGRTLTARHVVLSVPAAAAAALVTPFAPNMAALLGSIEYAPMSVVHLGFDRAAVRHALDGSGFLAPRRERCALNGSMWMSTLFPGRAPAGKIVLSNYVGGARLTAAAEWDDARTVDVVMQALAPVLGFDAGPEMVRIDRHRQALPLYHGVYAPRLREIARCLRSLPGLHLEANYKEGVAVRDRIVCASAAARRILNALGHASTLGGREAALGVRA